MNRSAPFPATLDHPDQLAERYRAPAQVVIDKVTGHIDQGVRDFLAVSTFVLVGTADTEGRQDVSPRGGPAGFARVLDERRLALPDLNGNNRLDTLRNVVLNPRIGLLFLVPGLGEMLRINGRAWVTTDDDLLDLFTDQVRRPATAIGVEVDEAYLHCAKAIRRGGLWEPSTWPAGGDQPSPGAIFLGHVGGDGSVTPAQVEANLEASYAEDLAADAPTG